jgi:hypothetical protein
MKPKWAQLSTDQQVAGPSGLENPSRGCGKKKALQELIDKRLIADGFSASKLKNSDSSHKNDAQLTMLTQLGDTVNKIRTAFAERMERKYERRDNEETIECLDTPECLEYQRDLAKTEALKLMLKCRLLEKSRQTQAEAPPSRARAWKGHGWTCS